MINRKTKTGGHDNSRLVAFGVLALVLVGALAVGAAVGYDALARIWREQFRIQDRDIDVVVTSGKLIHPDVITYSFGLTNGANLATIPFASLRADLLERYPNIRDIRIERSLPQRVTIEVFEREPIVRVVSNRARGETSRVADAEGVVFRFAGETGTLPIIQESGETPTPPGHRLTGSAAAALLLVEVASLPELAELQIRSIDTMHKDYLQLALANRDYAHVAWDHMNDRSPASRASLSRQLRHLLKTISANLTSRPVLWLATDWGTPGRVTRSDLARAGLK